MSTFGERLAKLRTENGYSQAELANRLSIAKSTLAMYETDKREPGFDVIQRISDFFDVKTDYLLLGRTDDDFLKDKNNSFTDNELNDPEFSAFFKEYKEAPEQRRRELKQFWEFLKQQEQGRKPGDKQGE